MVVGDGFFLGAPLDTEAPLGDLFEIRTGPGLPAPCLLEAVFLAHDALDFEVTADVVLVQDAGHVGLLSLGVMRWPRTCRRCARHSFFFLAKWPKLSPNHASGGTVAGAAGKGS